MRALLIVVIYWVFVYLCVFVVPSAWAGGGGDFFPPQQQMAPLQPDNGSVLLSPEVLGSLVAGGLGLVGVIYARNRKSD